MKVSNLVTGAIFWERELVGCANPLIDPLGSGMTVLLGCAASMEDASPHISWANGTQPRRRNEVKPKRKATALAECVGEFCLWGSGAEIKGVV